MNLQILVPQYKEDEGVICNLLDSLALQQNVDFDNDFGLVICNDGSDVILSQDFLNQYPFKVFYMARATNSGISATRNTLLDAATADYVMFCDADDMFLSACGLYVIFEEIKKRPFDLLLSPFVEETRDRDGRPMYVNHDKDGTFVHGKVHRLKHLRDNGIRFSERLPVHEDGAFNILSRIYAEETREVKLAFYLWKWNDNSVCRSEPDYLLKTYPYMVDQCRVIIEHCLARDRADACRYYAACGIYDMYFTLQQPEWREERNVEYRRELERRTQAFYNDYRGLFHALQEPDRSTVIADYRNRLIEKGVQFASITFDHWLNHIRHDEL